MQCKIRQNLCLVSLKLKESLHHSSCIILLSHGLSDGTSVWHTEGRKFNPQHIKEGLRETPCLSLPGEPLSVSVDNSEVDEPMGPYSE